MSDQPLSCQLSAVSVGRLVPVLCQLRCRGEVQTEDSHQGGSKLGGLVSLQPVGGGDMSGGRLSGQRWVDRLEQVGLLLPDLRDW